MEQQMVFFLALIAGFLFGASIVWLVQRSDARNAYDRAKTELSAELAAVEERAKGHEARIAELRTELEQRQAPPPPAVQLELPDWTQILQPLQESIHGVENHIVELRSARDSDSQDRRKLTADLDAVRELSYSIDAALLTFAERFAAVGKTLELALASHNEAALQLETSVMAASRRLKTVRGTPDPSTEDLARVAEAVGLSSRAPAEVPVEAPAWNVKLQ